MSVYPKIQSVFKRGPDHRFTDEYSRPEFEYLKDNPWSWEEKVDGMNVRVTWENGARKIQGRSDNTEFPPGMLGHLEAVFTPEKLGSVWGETLLSVVMYGEGVGGKIQGTGARYVQGGGYDFILFDVHLGAWWLDRRAVKLVAEELGVRKTPEVGILPLTAAVAQMRDTPLRSVLGDGLAEGLVLRPLVELRTVNGERVIAKLKSRDFVQVQKEVKP